MSRLNFEIYQLRKSRATTDRKGKSLKGLKMHGMQLEADLYEKVYRSAITLWDRRNAVDILEELYDTYRRYFPDDYTGSAVGLGVETGSMVFVLRAGGFSEALSSGSAGSLSVMVTTVPLPT